MRLLIRSASSTLLPLPRNFPSGRSCTPDGPWSWVILLARRTAWHNPVSSWRGVLRTALGRCTGPACPVRNTVRQSTWRARLPAVAVDPNSSTAVATVTTNRSGGVPWRTRPPCRFRTYINVKRIIFFMKNNIAVTRTVIIVQL